MSSRALEAAAARAVVMLPVRLEGAELAAALLARPMESLTGPFPFGL
jgi:hypothetical protein